MMIRPLYRLLVCIFLAHLYAPLTMTKQLRVPQPDVPGLLIPDDAIPLRQSDFSSGSYRVSKPGYYYFVEDILFNPKPALELQRSDKPLIGAWFTALSVECDNVIIDLNTKTFACDPEFLDSQKLKVFSLVEFGNSPFPLAKFPFFAYTGETQPIFANNITIKNGTIGASPHHGLHGNSNSNIQIYDIVARDWEVAGIAFNGLKSGVIRNVTITGLEHPMDFTGLVSVMLAAQVVLEDLRDNEGDVHAQEYITALQPLIQDETQNGAIHPTRLNYGNAYGIFLNRAFDIGPVAQVVNDQSSNAIIIENVLIANITTQLLETVAIGNSQGQTMMAELFGTFRWEDAYPQGTFAPNALLKAQVYAQQQRAPQKMPEGFAANILSNSPDEALFLSHTRPVFGLDFPGHANKGIFGIRVDAGYGVTIRNCSVMGLNNRGLPGKGLTDIAAGHNYTFTVPRYAGNDVHGISLAVCRNCAVIDSDISECSSDRGNVYGIALRHQTDASQINGAAVTNLRAYGDNSASTINPSSVVYGLLIDTQCHATTIQDLAVHTLTAPRFVYGLYAHNVTDTRVSDSHISDLTVSAAPSLALKQVAAYASLASYATRIEDSQARVIRVLNEDAATKDSASVAAGYLLGDAAKAPDQYPTLEGNTAECIAGGAGVAAGVLLGNLENGTIINNTCSYSVSGGQSSRGYGLYNSMGLNLTGLIIKNTAYGNSIKQYEFTGARYAVTTLNTQSTTAVLKDTGWHNIAYQ